MPDFMPLHASAGYSMQNVCIRHLTLSHYRNYALLRQGFRGGRIVLTGLNGAGKTNLLEAISLLSPGRGLRYAGYADMVGNSFGESAEKQQNFTVSVDLHSSLYGDVHIGTELAVARADSAAGDYAAGMAVKTQGRSRRLYINSVFQPAETVLEYCRILWIIPAQDGLFTGGAAARRSFLDRMVLALDNNHARRVLDYEKLMRSRNRLLAEARSDVVWLAALEAQMAALGTAIAAARQEAVARLNAVAAPIFPLKIFPQALLSIQGLQEAKLQQGSALDAEEFYSNLLRNNREKDAAAGRCLEGPHRSDLIVFHKEKNIPAALCSTGEQKALLTGMILSHARLTAETAAVVPILLLDEIAAHLDAQKREALFAVLEDLNAQAFMTGTDKKLFSALTGYAEFFHVADGVLQKEN